MGTHQARCCLLGAGCTLLAVGTLRESRCSVRAGAVTSYSAAISWTGQGEAGGGGRGWVAPHCLLVSVLGVYLCVTTCTGARDPTESPLSQVRCGVLSMCGVPSSSGGEHGAQLPTPPHAVTSHTLTPPVTATLTHWSQTKNIIYFYLVLIRFSSATSSPPYQ